MTTTQLIGDLAKFLPKEVAKRVDEALISKSNSPDGYYDPEVRVCDLSNDDDEKYHFVEIDEVSAVTVRRNEFISIFFNKD